MARHPPSRPGPIVIVAGALCGALLLAGGCGELPDGDAIDTDLIFGEVGLSNGQFSYPRAIDAAFGSVVVIDKTARVQRFDSDTGGYLGGFRMPEWELGKPTGVTLGPSLDDPSRIMVYVADSHYHRVFVYPLPDDASGDARTITEPVLSFGEYGLEGGQFVYVSDIALLLDADGAVERMYVSEYGGNDRVSVFDIDRTGETARPRFAFTFGHFGDEPGTPGAGDFGFERPQAMAIDYDTREIVILDDCNHRIGRFTLDGKLITWIGDDAGEATFLNPQGFALLEGRRALVAEFLGNRVQLIDLDTGASLATYGHAGRLEGELASPWGVAVDGREAFVLDSGNNRVQRFRAPGEAIGTPWKGSARAVTHAGGTP